MDGPVGAPAEVSWARQMLERSEREYSAMVDELLRENQQLETLARLLSEQFKDLISGVQHSNGQADLSVLSRLEDVLCSIGPSRSERTEVIALQKSLRNQEVEAQSLRRRLEEALQELVEPQFSPEDFASHKARRGELAETRCSLVLERCQETVQRLEAGLTATRQELESARLTAAQRMQASSEPGALPSTSSLSRPGCVELDSQ